MVVFREPVVGSGACKVRVETFTRGVCSSLSNQRTHIATHGVWGRMVYTAAPSYQPTHIDSSRVNSRSIPSAAISSLTTARRPLRHALRRGVAPSDVQPRDNRWQKTSNVHVRKEHGPASALSTGVLVANGACELMGRAN